MASSDTYSWHTSWALSHSTVICSLDHQEQHENNMLRYWRGSDVFLTKIFLIFTSFSESIMSRKPSGQSAVTPWGMVVLDWLIWGGEDRSWITASLLPTSVSIWLDLAVDKGQKLSLSRTTNHLYAGQALFSGDNPILHLQQLLTAEAYEYALISSLQAFTCPYQMSNVVYHLGRQNADMKQHHIPSTMHQRNGEAVWWLPLITLTCETDQPFLDLEDGSATSTDFFTLWL